MGGTAELTPEKPSVGQALVEYAILVFVMITVFAAIVTPFCLAFDEFLRGIYFVLQAPFP